VSGGAPQPENTYCASTITMLAGFPIIWPVMVDVG